jgi:MFS family permease
MSEPVKFSSHFGGISRALSNPKYRTYWLGQIVMVQGFWIYKIVAGWMMFEMTQSPVWLGALGSAYMLPIFLLGPFGGAVADRFGYRRIAMIMGGTGACLAFITGMLAYVGSMNPVLLLVLTIFQGLLFAFEFPARQALFPQLMKREDMSAAVAVNSTTFHSSSFTGPLIGGLLLQTNIEGIGFVANSFCMFWMMGAIFLIPSPKNIGDRLAEKKASGILNDLKDGLRYTHNHVDIRLLIILTLTASLLLRHYLDFLPGFSGEIFNRGKEGLATLTAAAGVGAMIFSTYLAIRGRTKGMTNFLFIGQFVAATALIIFSSTNNFMVALVALVFVGGLLNSAAVCIQSLIQHTVEDGYRARVISINVSLAVGAPAISAPLVGWIAEFYGLQLSLAGSAMLALLILVPIGLILRKRRYELESVKD